MNFTFFFLKLLLLCGEELVRSRCRYIPPLCVFSRCRRLCPRAIVAPSCRRLWVRQLWAVCKVNYWTDNWIFLFFHTAPVRERTRVPFRVWYRIQPLFAQCDDIVSWNLLCKKSLTTIHGNGKSFLARAHDNGENFNFHGEFYQIQLTYFTVSS